MRIYNAWNRGGLTSEWVEVTGKWGLWQKCCMKLVTELECIWRHDGGEARKWKDCAKTIREKEGGWLSLLAVTSGHLRLKNISSAIGQTKHPCACFMSPSLLYTDDRTRTPGSLDSNRKPPNSLSLSLFCWLSVHKHWREWNQAWNMERLIPAHCNLLHHEPLSAACCLLPAHPKKDLVLL